MKKSSDCCCASEVIELFTNIFGRGLRDRERECTREIAGLFNIDVKPENHYEKKKKKKKMRMRRERKKKKNPVAVR